MKALAATRADLCEGVRRVSTLRRVLLEERLRGIGLRIERLKVVGGGPSSSEEGVGVCESLLVQHSELEATLLRTDQTAIEVFKAARDADTGLPQAMQTLEDSRRALHVAVTSFLGYRQKACETERIDREAIEKGEADLAQLQHALDESRTSARRAELAALQQVGIEAVATERTLKTEIRSAETQRRQITLKVLHMKERQKTHQSKLETKVGHNLHSLARRREQERLRLQGMHADMAILRQQIKRMEQL